MAINNFVNFITDTITPPVIDQYSGGTLSCPDFCGSDSSTAEYTKLGWVYKCYMDMVKRGLVDAEVDSFVQSMQELDKNNIELLRSPSGFNILQIIIFDRRSEKDFTLANGLSVANIEDLRSVMYTADNPGGQTAMHMAVDYGLKDLVYELGIDDVGHIDDPGRAGEFLSPWSLAMVRGAEEIISGSQTTNRRDLAELMSTVTVDSYDDFFGANPRYSGGGGKISNEISRIIMSTSHEVFKEAIKWMTIPLSPSAGILTASGISTSGGISAGNVTFNPAEYSASESESGYHPLYFYIYKYKTSVDIDTLVELSSYFSPVSVSISENGETEGFTAVGLAAHYLTLSASGEWNNLDMAGWIKSTLERCGSNSDQIWAVSGNVRDFTNGSSNNAFGAITNILVKINEIHSAWWTENEEDEDVSVNDFESSYLAMAGSVLPESLDYGFYRIWMVEYGKEIG